MEMGKNHTCQNATGYANCDLEDDIANPLASIYEHHRKALALATATACGYS